VCEVVVGAEIRATPAVDRLFGIPDEKQSRSSPGIAVECQAANQLTLERVGVLELVDEQLIEVTADAARHTGAIDEQVARAAQQRVVAGRTATAHFLEHFDQ
jgi:hypothetical protein